jgi:hypothetical protein
MATSTDDTNEDDLTSNSFPFELYRMLVMAKEDGKESIVSFTPRGHVTQIHEPNEFLTQVLPQFFKSNRIKSFIVVNQSAAPIILM